MSSLACRAAYDKLCFYHFYYYHYHASLLVPMIQYVLFFKKFKLCVSYHYTRDPDCRFTFFFYILSFPPSISISVVGLWRNIFPLVQISAIIHGRQRSVYQSQWANRDMVKAAFLKTDSGSRLVFTPLYWVCKIRLWCTVCVSVSKN